jgi:hypothetical protein
VFKVRDSCHPAQVDWACTGGAGCDKQAFSSRPTCMGAGSGRLGLASGVVPAGLTRSRRAAAGLASGGFVEPAGATPWTDSTED